LKESRLKVALIFRLRRHYGRSPAALYIRNKDTSTMPSVPPSRLQRHINHFGND